IKEHNLDLLRRNTGVVPQEVFLFSDTISNNISFGSHLKSDIKNVEKAAKDAGVYDNIVSFPNKFDTLVGERGVTLSGGQKQRISIARAVIGEPQLLLFDDCLSAVDVETEEAILHNLQKKMNQKTSIFISHRISTIKNADLIIYLDNGQITEMGSHNELLTLKKKYYKLSHLQGS
ncbi:MAG: ATP-binding cassette domain-containing protein, partial [Bacteroidia bacterium]